MVLAVGLGRSEILGDRVLCVQAVCSKVAGALSWEGGVSSFLCVCACVYVCHRETARDKRDRDRGMGGRGDPISPPWASARQNEVHWFSSRWTITWTGCE